MAATDARPGFRLPWNSDQRPTDDSVDGVESGADASATSEDQFAAQPAEADMMSEAVDTSTDPSEAPAPAPAPAAPAALPGGPKRPSKFLADLTKAMQAAAESAREETLGRLQTDAKTHVEDIHARSTNEAADLRRQADDDVAAIREWSKAEIARIREETETRIATRKGRLETEIEEHAALIERQIERVQGRVAAFEQEMAAFFERLLSEDDPTRFASMAESLPEPPPFDSDVAAVAAAAMVSPDDGPANGMWSAAEQGAADDPDATMVAIQAAAEAAAAADAEAPEMADELGPPPDPRLSALGLDTDFDAAEADSFAAADSGDEIPTIGDEALAARLAGLVPPDEREEMPEAGATKVIVTGLVSVASIASFKRHLGRLPGVQSVGVSSGPDGEFVFTVAHGDGVSLRDAVPSLPGFRARVTGGSDHVVEVSAKDPENEA